MSYLRKYSCAGACQWVQPSALGEARRANGIRLSTVCMLRRARAEASQGIEADEKTGGRGKGRRGLHVRMPSAPNPVATGGGAARQVHGVATPPVGGPPAGPTSARLPLLSGHLLEGGDGLLATTRVGSDPHFGADAGDGMGAFLNAGL